MQDNNVRRGSGLTLAACLGLSLCACSTAPKAPGEAAAAPAEDWPAANVPAEPASASGNPQSYTVNGKRYWVSRSSAGFRQRGLASWYGTEFHGRRTSSGEPFDMYRLSAAHKTLPIPTYARITRLDTGRSIVVKVNDRGPFVDDRVIDLSYAAAKKLGIVTAGTAPVEVTALAPYQTLAEAKRPRAQPAASKAVASADPEPPAYYAEPILRAAAYTPLAQQAIGKPAAYLQIGAFAARTSAEQLQQRLRPRLVRAVSVTSRANGLHRVWIGPVASRDEVDLLKLQLAKLGFSDSYLVYD